jgi:ABC-type sugar transport system ATPase subunit
MTAAAISTAVSARGLRKRYGSTQALAGVDVDLQRGEIHGVIGPNGAGKSTFVKILAGVVAPDEGEISLDGRPAALERPQDALAHGLAFVHQQLLVAPGMTVLDNIFVGLDTPVRLRRVDKPAMRRRLAPVLERMKVELDVDVPIEQLSVTQQRFTMIARALLVDARVIVLDEPTASLDIAEVQRLFDVLRELRSQGIAVLFISHRLGEVLELCDRVTVLRDGRTQSTSSAAQLTMADLLRAMGAEEELSAADQVHDVRGAPPLLRVRELTAEGLPRPISFDVHAGEIVGLAGVVGSGRSRLAKTLVGIHPRLSGVVAAPGGMVLMPENRAVQGISLRLKVRENVTLGILPRVFRRGPLGTRRRRHEIALASRLLDRVGLDPARLEDETGSLSGGMQQRVMFARVLAADAQVAVLDEPTQGVDIATKLSLHRLIRSLAEAGRALIVISSEFEELVALSDRIICLNEGRIAAELTAPGLTPGRIINALWKEAR